MIICYMIQETITYTCHSCDSINIIRNGTNKCGNQQYHCKDCGVYRVLTPQTSRLSEAEKQKVLQAYRERVNLRGLERTFRVCRKSVMQWLATEIDQTYERRYPSPRQTFTTGW